MNAYNPQAYTIPGVDALQAELATPLHLYAITGSNLGVCSSSGEAIALRLFTLSGALNALGPDSICPFSAARISSARTLRASQD